MKFTGKHISGEGNAERLDLLERSFSMLHSSPVLPNLNMLYKSAADMLSEGFIWGCGWWIQNSFGFTMGAVPLLDELWSNILCNSYDAFWRRIGDGKRIGKDEGYEPNHPLDFICAPDGSLGDCVGEHNIIYKQGDGDFHSYDWFYEATAAGVLMTAEMLIFSRDNELIQKYVPLMKRSVNHIENARAKNGLFLVGPACNLLAPGYGGSFNEETGELEKGYLTGISVTYSAALRKFIEVLKLAGDHEFADECRARLDKNLAALPLLLTDEGYYAKSMDQNGTKHGVYGADRYGYLEAVCNVDAIAWDIADRDTAEKIYKKISEVDGIRPKGVICNNYPHLDDTLVSYRTGSKEPNSLGFHSGDWVDGGCWGTVEGRAILAYLKLGKYEDAYRAAAYYMKWAEEYRQDAPLSQWGYNTCNPWQAENEDYTVCDRPCSIMIDNFAAVTCLLRGMFDCTADADGVSFKPQIPDDINWLDQNEPIHFAGTSIYIHYVGGCGKLSAVLGDTELAISEDGRIMIPAGLLANQGDVCLSISKAGKAESIDVSEIKRIPELTGDIDGVPEDIRSIYEECREKLGTAEGQYAMQLREILLSAEASAMRRRLPFDKHELRPMTEEKINVIITAYDNTVRELYKGLVYRR